MTYDELVADNNDVDILDRAFKSKRIKGLYYNSTIAINNNIETSNEKKCILAEELGHHYTSSGNIVNVQVVNNRKQENIARLWAYQKLVSLDALVDAFEHHCTNRFEVAEYLGVTEEFLLDSINAYMHKYGNYIKHNEYIIEFGDDSVSIMKMF